VENVPDPKILNSRDATVKISSTAICGSDLHLLDGYIPTMKKGDILGHEFMGEVTDIGRDVQNLKVGDRVVVPFPIACGSCNACKAELYSCCENSNPNGGIAEKMMGHSTAGIFGYSHMTGGYGGGQAEAARIPFADIGPIKIENGFSDEQVPFLSDIFPTGYMGADMCDIERGDVIAVWGAGPVGQFAIASAGAVRCPGHVARAPWPRRGGSISRPAAGDLPRARRAGRDEHETMALEQHECLRHEVRASPATARARRRDLPRTDGLAVVLVLGAA